MRQSTSTIEVHNGVIGRLENPRELKRSRRISPITKTLVACIVFAGAYAAFQRIGTTANANVVEFTRNLAGGFLAVGMTEDQPGFIALSALDQNEVSIRADWICSSLAGTHTIVDVQTPSGATRIRLRSPRIILVSKDGAIETHAVRWTVDDFNILREAADCSDEAATPKTRCGAPFTDLREAIATWPDHRVPDQVRAFLEPFADTREHKHQEK